MSAVDTGGLTKHETCAIKLQGGKCPGVLECEGVGWTEIEAGGGWGSEK